MGAQRGKLRILVLFKEHLPNLYFGGGGGGGVLLGTGVRRQNSIFSRWAPHGRPPPRKLEPKRPFLSVRLI